MEKILTPYDKEYMKMAMLKHEETFKEQVYELHRLYQIQKQLMKNIASTRPSAQNQNQIIINAHHQNLENLEGKGEVKIEDESEIELTLGPSSFNKRRRKLETPLNSDSGASFSSSSSGSNLQLKKIDRAREGQNRQKWGILDRRDSNPGFLNGTRNISSGEEEEEEEEELRQDRLQQSPWLFQVLSLNMT